MRKGFAQIIFSAMIGFIVLMLVLSIAPTLGTQQLVTFSNASVFPTNGVTYVIGNFTTLFFILAGIIAGVGLIVYGGRGELN